MDGLDNLGGSGLDRDNSRGPTEFADVDGDTANATGSSSSSSSQYAPVVDIYTVPPPSLKQKKPKPKPKPKPKESHADTVTTASSLSPPRRIAPTPVARHPPVVQHRERSDEEVDSINVESDDDDDDDDEDDDEDEDDAQSYHDEEEEEDDDEDDDDMTGTKSYADGWKIGGGGAKTTTTTATTQHTAHSVNPLHRRRRGARASATSSSSTSSAGSAGANARRKKSRHQQQQQHAPQMHQTRIVVNNPDPQQQGQQQQQHTLGYLPDASGLAMQQDRMVDPHADDDFGPPAAAALGPAAVDAQTEHGMRTLHPPSEEDGGRWVPCPLPSEVAQIQQERDDERYAEMKRASAAPGFSGCEMCDIGDAACTRFTSQVLAEILQTSDTYDGKMDTDGVYALMAEEYNRNIYAEAKRLDANTHVQEWTVPMVRYHMENHDSSSLRRRIQKQVTFWENLQKETRRYAGVMERYVLQGHATAHTRINADCYSVLKDQTTMLLKLYDTQHKLAEAEFRREVAIARQESIAEAAGKKTTIGRLGKLSKVRQARTTYFQQKRLRQESTANMTASSLAIYSKESMAVKGKGSLAATNGVIKIEDPDAIEGGAENQSILVDRHQERSGRRTGSAHLRQPILY